MDIMFIVLSAALAFCRTIMADNIAETYEKFYTADTTYTPTPGGKHQHNAMGISTVARFSMLSNTPTLFKVKRPGLKNDVNTVSFESIQKPGFYLRYKNYKFYMEEHKETDIFQKDATFRERLGPRGRAYELLGRDNWFVCHSDNTPYTLEAKLQQIGTTDFVDNCVYVPVRQKAVDKKNIVKTVPSGGAIVVNAVPSTQTTDKCISLRFVNKLGGPVRVVSSMKPEGYLVTANAFKLKTIFKHANHKQRHVIFYAENIQDRDDDILLNAKNVFTIKPGDCGEQFQDVVLSSHADETKMKDTSPQRASEGTLMNAALKPTTILNETPQHSAISGDTPKPAAMSGDVPKPPAMNADVPKPSAMGGYVPKPSAMNADVPKPPAMNADVPKPPAMGGDVPKPSAMNADVPKHLAMSLSGDIPKPPATNGDTSIPTAINDVAPRQPVNNNVTPRPLTTSSGIDAYEIGSPSMNTLTMPPVSESAILSNPSSWNKASSVNPSPDYTVPLRKEIHNLDNILQKRLKNTLSPGTDTTNGYNGWSSYSPCSVSCGVGYRRRTRICRPGVYCSGSTAETRACIKEQCASDCIHTTGGSVKSGSCCHFPFTFNGGQYYHCILSSHNNERLWCATSPYYEQDKKWGFCPRSTKAPVRSIIKAVKSIGMPQTIKSYAATNSMPTQYSTYYNKDVYNSPYKTANKDNSIPCNPMCSRVCITTCAKHCCLSTRNDVPYSAYMGNNYGPTDKRSSIQPYQARSPPYQARFTPYQARFTPYQTRYRRNLLK